MVNRGKTPLKARKKGNVRGIRIPRTPVQINSSRPPNPANSEEGLLDSLKRDMMGLGQNQTGRPKMPRVPWRWRKIKSNKDCYEPQEISIGPYHVEKEHLRHMQKLKLSTASEYMKDKSSTIEELWGDLKKVAGEARKFYAADATQGMSDPEFTLVMFLDGCFILQFISGHVEMTTSEYTYVQRDLFLLENQLPFIVLKALVGYSNEEERSNLIAKMREFVMSNWQTPSTKEERSWSWKEDEPLHLLQLLREFLLIHPTEVNTNAPSRMQRSKGWARRCARALDGALGLRASSAEADEGGLSNNSGKNHNAKEQKKVVNEASDGGILDAKEQKKGSGDVKDQKKVRNRASDDNIFDSDFIHYPKEQKKIGNRATNDDIHNAREQMKASDDVKDQKKAGKKASEDDNWDTYRSAKELKKVGISFRASETHSFSDVRFRHTRTSLGVRGELELPLILIDDSTKSILLNLVAYEMCAEESADVVSYLWFLDKLMDHVDDVMVLRSKGILHNCLGSDQEVADLFNTIAKDLVPNAKAYASVIKQIDTHCQNQFKIWIMERWYTYFEPPWSRISFVAAVTALTLSFIQTYFAIGDSQ